MIIIIIIIHNHHHHYHHQIYNAGLLALQNKFFEDLASTDHSWTWQESVPQMRRFKLNIDNSGRRRDREFWRWSKWDQTQSTCLSVDGRLASGGFDGSIVLYDAEGQELRRLVDVHGGQRVLSRC